MTLTAAFDELVSIKPEWCKSVNITKEKADKLSARFLKNGSHAAQIKRILKNSGYMLTETWSNKNTHQPVYNDINTPKAVKTPRLISSVLETMLFKQANNPLGDPHKL